MKAENLMIGDWIKFQLDEDLSNQNSIETVIDLYKVGKVSALDDNGNVRITDNEGQEYQVTEDKIKPISVTEELLEKNDFGFLDTSNNEIKSVWTGWWILDGGLELGCFSNLKFPTFFNISDVNIQVNYVHELQHALKLCRIEKEIVL